MRVKLHATTEVPQWVVGGTPLLPVKHTYTKRPSALRPAPLRAGTRTLPPAVTVAPAAVEENSPDEEILQVLSALLDEDTQTS